MAVGIPDVEVVRVLADLIVHIVLHGRSAFLGSLGGDQDDTIGTTGTIDGGRGSILQYIDALDVVGRDVVNTRHLYAIHHIQRLIALGDGSASTDTDGHGGTGTTVLRDDIHTGQLSLQGFCDVADGIGSEFVTGDGSHSTCQVLTLHRTITDHHHVFQRGVVLFEGDVQLRLASHIDGLGLVADIRDFQSRIVRNADGEVSVEIGHSTLAIAIDDTNSNQWFA